MAITAEKLHDLLSETTVADSERISRATQELRRIYKDSTSLPVLLRLLQQATSPAIRQLAAVESRKQVAAHWTHLGSDVKAAIKASLLQSTLQENDRPVQHASSRVIAGIAQMELPAGTWDELTRFLIGAATSRTVSDRVVGVYIFFSLLDTLDDFFLPQIHDLFQLFSNTISDPESIEVRDTSLLALGRLAELVPNGDKVAIKAFRLVLPDMMKVLQQVISDGESASARQAFEVFQNLLILEPHLLNKHLIDVVRFMVQASCFLDVAESNRIMCLSWLLTCCRYRKNKIKSSGMGPTLVQAMLRVAAEEGEEADDDDEDSPVSLAHRLIDVLSTSLPPSQVAQPLMSSVPTMLLSDSVGQRKSALNCLGNSFAGAVEWYSERLPEVLAMIKHGLLDACGNVQRAALGSLGLLADEFADEMAQEYALLLPAVFELMHSNDVHVAKSAMSALEIILEGLSEEMIVQYLPQLMSSFFAILRSNADTASKSVVVAALGSAAHAAQESFAPYLSETADILAPTLTISSAADLEFRALVLDTFGSIAGATGAARSSPLFQMVASSAQEALSFDHSRLRESSFCFFAILAKLSTQDFAAYVPTIMPALLASLDQDEVAESSALSGEQTAQDGNQASLPLQLNATGLDDDYEDDEQSEDDWMKSLGINSAIAMEKEIAADALGEIFSHAKQAVLPFLEVSSKALLSCLDHYYEGVRRAAIGSLNQIAATLYLLSNSSQWLPGIPIKVPLHDHVQECTAVIRKATLQLLMIEDDQIVTADTCRHFAETIRLCGPGVLGPEADLKTLCDILLDIFNQRHASQTAEQMPIHGDEEDEEAIVDAADEETEELEAVLLDAASDVLISLSFTLGDQFVQPFGLFLPSLLRLSCSKSSTSSRASAVAAFGEISGGLKSGVTPFTYDIYNALMRGLQDENKEVRSNSAYALGLLCLHTKNSLSGHYLSILQMLQPFFGVGNHKFAKDNAMGCIARMTLADPDAMPLDQVLPVMMQHLPLQEDYAENQPIYQMFIHLYSIGHANVLSRSAELVPIFLSVLAGEPAQLSTESRAELSALVDRLNV